MKKLFVILAMAATVALGGCAAEMAKFQQVISIATTATVPPSTAQVAVSSFQVVEAGATEYFKYCKTTPADVRCSADTLRAAIKYDRQGRAARDQIKAAGKTGALISSTAYNLLVTATTNLTTTPASTFGATK